MRIVVGVVLGLFSSFVLYLMAMILLVSSDGRNEVFPVAILIFLSGWIGSAWLIVRGAESTAKVFARGFLLGAAEWLAMIFMGIILSQKLGGAGVIRTFLTGGFSFFMALICLACFAVAHFWGRTMKAESKGKLCPMCAETIQAEARLCRFCGAALISNQ